MSTPLWTPTTKQQRSSSMWHFMEFVNESQGLSLHTYNSLYQWSIEHKADFWASVWKYCGIIASQPWKTVVEDTGEFPGYKWFSGSRLNFAENLLRHAATQGSQSAIVFWAEDRIKRNLSYTELNHQVTALASAMRKAGVSRGDRVAAFISNIPEAVIGMLATTSIGAIWSSCSPDFGFNGVLDRFGQIEPKLLICSDGYYFKGQTINSLDTIRKIEEAIPSLKEIVVIPYTSLQTDISQFSKATFYKDFLGSGSDAALEFEQLPFMHPLYIMYSSGTTGKPKCIVHGAGGTLLQHLKELMLHTNIGKNDRIFYFTTCGWMMWNWLISSIATGATLMLYDGAPMYPTPDFLFEYADRENITVFGTSARYLSALQKSGSKPNNNHNLTNLRTILSTGSPLLPDSYDYVYQNISFNVQLSSISGGTDIISCFALGNPLLPVYRGELQCIGMGMEVKILDTNGKSIREQCGELACIPPFPSMPVYFWNDTHHNKYRSAYFERYPGVWAHGDFAELTCHNGLVIYGRSDAVLNPGGVRIGTAEIYRQVEKFPNILECIAVGQEWDGDTRIILFVKLADKLPLDEQLKTKIKQAIRKNTTPRHVPAKVIQVPDIPRTISGKIVELAVTNIIHQRPVKNQDALANPEALDAFKNIQELQEE